MSISGIIKTMLPDINGVSAYMSSDFGSRESFVDYHEGVDFSYGFDTNNTKPKVGSPVSGTVVGVKIDGSGRVTIKDDATGLYHDILHLDSSSVIVGKHVNAGEEIGKMGNTGTDAIHVHYQIRTIDSFGETYLIDPEQYWNNGVLMGGQADNTIVGIDNKENIIYGDNSKEDPQFPEEGNDNLTGGQYADRIYGMKGDDTINGGGGNDYLEGGTGFDTYNFNFFFGVDTVNDSDRFGKVVINGNWIKGEASLVVEGSGGGNVSNNSVNGGNNGGNNNVGGASTDKVHQLSINGVTYYLKMLSGVLLISESRESLNLVSGDVVKIQGFVDGQFGISLEQPDDSKFGAGSVVDKWRVAEASDPNAYYRIDPLTLDLDGDGVELVSLSENVDLLDKMKEIVNLSFCFMFLFLIVFSNSGLAANEIKDSYINPKDIRAKLVFKSKNFNKEEKEVIDLVEKTRKKPSEGQWRGDSTAVSYNLDNKGKDEVFYFSSSNFDCGSAGCDITLYQYKNKKWQIVQHFRTMGDILVLNSTIDGYYDISMSFKYSKELTDDEIEKLKITKEQLKNLGRSVMDWKNFTLHWKKNSYCSEELKNC